jgi:tripartite-type tricarboxylate transporter receptor subunit TctC
MNSRQLLLMMMASLSAAAPAVHAAYPEKAIRIIVPYPPGGNIDITARAIAPGLTDALGQQIVIDNRGGAGGTIGAELAAKATPDGYTTVLGSTGTLTTAPALYPRLGYDPVRDFATTSLVSSVPLVMVIHPSVPAKNVKEFIAIAKSRPGRITMASAGSGTTNHLSGELFQSASGTKMIHIPYKGSGPALIDLMGGQVDVHFDQMTTSIGFIQSGKLRAIAVTTLKRSAQMPAIPTMNESGLPGFDASTFTGIVLPAATPRDVVTKLHAALIKVLRSKATRDSFARFGADVLESTPEEFSRFIRADLAKWSKVVREAGIKLE